MSKERMFVARTGKRGLAPRTSMKYSAQEPRSEVRNLAFAIWEERVQRGGRYFGDARSDWFTARNQLGMPPDLLL